ncbi:MAG: alpha/beta hydrolase [Bacteriovoracaceae bacterium]|nr:alpha/beta hydrolase [Bacteriovoracaceae bacterium]
MNRTIANFRNYVFELIPNEDKNSETAILMFHGFPSESHNGTTQEKNVDLLKALSNATKLDSYLHHYNGLGENKDGNFSFNGSIQDSFELANLLLEKYSKLILVAHSWGGVVAVNCLNKLHSKISNMILLSPLNELPDSTTLEFVLTEITKDVPFLLKNRSISDYINDFDQIRNNFNPRELIGKTFYKGDVLILQAEHDNEVPKESTNEFINLFNGNLSYEILDTDHSFTKNRELMLNKCISNIIKYV